MVANKRANPLWGGFLVTDGPVLCLYDQYTHPFNFIIRDPDKKRDFILPGLDHKQHRS